MGNGTFGAAGASPFPVPVSRFITTMPPRLLPADVAARIHLGFETYQQRFHAITRRGPDRFAARDWRGAQEDALERLSVYGEVLDALVEELRAVLGVNVRNTFFWRAARASHTRLHRDTGDAELARTFWNSVTRRIFSTVGVDPDIEYLDHAGSRRLMPDPVGPAVTRRYGVSDLAATLEEVLAALPFRTAFRDLQGDAVRAARSARHQLAARDPAARPRMLHLVSAVFYRNKGAYLIGRLELEHGSVPLVLALTHPEGGIVVDAVLVSEDEASIVFSFTRSYFHVDIAQPRALVAFLRSLMPLKPVDELFNALGYNKHGKTVLYRHLIRHLEHSSDRFRPAEGDKGLVMAVFTLPAMNIVFKVIRDHFGHPKTTTRRVVMQKYHLVFIRDRVGRLADAQEFEHLEFDAARFDPEVLEELLAEASGAVRLERGRVIIRHLYTERKVTPLNLYLRSAPPVEAEHAVVDYGNAIKELAAANIFTGDMLLKNFGVTRHGRVIFYDYDELSLLTECNFRRLPEPADVYQEMAAEPWYSVAEGDVFPEEFRPFLVLPGRLGEVFLEAHADLLTVEFWRNMQAHQREGEVVDVFPYREERRLLKG